MTFNIPKNVKTVFLYPEPIPMNWGEKKLTQLCKEKMGIDPAFGGVFLFFNSKLNQLKLFFLDETGSQELMKWLPNGNFMVPVRNHDEKFIPIARNKIEKLFKF